MSVCYLPWLFSSFILLNLHSQVFDITRRVHSNWRRTGLDNYRWVHLNCSPQKELLAMQSCNLVGSGYARAPVPPIERLGSPTYFSANVFMVAIVDKDLRRVAGDGHRGHGHRGRCHPPKF